MSRGVIGPQIPDQYTERLPSGRLLTAELSDDGLHLYVDTIPRYRLTGGWVEEVPDTLTVAIQERVRAWGRALAHVRAWPDEFERERA